MSEQSSSAKPSFRPTAILVTTAMLSFISFWRAGAIVLCDLGSSAFYAGGIAEQAIGRAAPWFILGIMLFANCVRMVYVESCSLFVRGGVYKVVSEAMGHGMAKVSVSALMFDYILTGPISAVSAGQYMVGFLNSLFHWMHFSHQFNRDIFSCGFAVLVILYFWRKNLIGIEESSEKALKIIIITSIVGVMMVGFCAFTLWVHPQVLPPFKPVLNHESLGWLKDFSWAQSVGTFGIVLGLCVGLGHSLLAMSGEESLAQVYREIEAPKLKNLKKTAVMIGLFSLLFTSLMTFFAVMIIPDDIRISQYADNLIGGLAMHVYAPQWLRLSLNALVVLVGFLILSGAVNTSFVGSNGVLNRVAEDGVLTDWFRIPHPKYGTTAHTIHFIVILQLLTVLLCRGDVYLLGEAYAFGVIWSFTLKTLAMIVLRYKDKTPREWKVPLNFRFGNVEIPLGLILIFLVLALLAVTNLFTKPIATEWGVGFTLSLFILFSISEKIHKKERGPQGALHFQEKVNLKVEESISAESYGLEKPHRLLVTVRDPNNLYHFKKVLEEFDPESTDCVVMAAKVIRPYQMEGDMTHLFPDEESLLTHIVNLAEKAGKTVVPLLVPAKNPFYAIAKVAHDLKVEEVEMGLSGKMSVERQMESMAIAWGSLEEAASQGIRFRVIWPNREFVYEI